MGSSPRGLVDSNCFYNSPVTTESGEVDDVELAGPPSAVREFVASER